MVAHSEAEWRWWMDSDVVITDMEFEHPLEKYKEFNVIIHGWMENVYKKRSWLEINARVGLLYYLHVFHPLATQKNGFPTGLMATANEPADLTSFVFRPAIFENCVWNGKYMIRISPSSPPRE